MISKLFAITLDLIIHEVNEDLIIIKEIFKFYGESIIENFHKQQKKRVLRKKMKKTINYKQWKSLALSFDKLPGNFSPLLLQKTFFNLDIKFYKENIFSNLYDYNYIQKLRNDLLLAKNSSNPYILIQLLRSHSFRNIAGYLNPELYNVILEQKN